MGEYQRMSNYLQTPTHTCYLFEKGGGGAWLINIRRNINKTVLPVTHCKLVLFMHHRFAHFVLKQILSFISARSFHRLCVSSTVTFYSKCKAYLIGSSRSLHTQGKLLPMVHTASDLLACLRCRHFWRCKWTRLKETVCEVINQCTVNSSSKDNSVLTQASHSDRIYRTRVCI